MPGTAARRQNVDGTIPKTFSHYMALLSWKFHYDIFSLTTLFFIAKICIINGNIQHFDTVAIKPEVEIRFAILVHFFSWRISSGPWSVCVPNLETNGPLYMKLKGTTNEP